jgi:hypothetical protein
MAVLNVPSSLAGTCGCGGTLLSVPADAAAQCSQCGFRVTSELLHDPRTMRQAYEQYKRARRYADREAWSATCPCGAPWDSAERSVETDDYSPWQAGAVKTVVTSIQTKVTCLAGHDVHGDGDLARVVQTIAEGTRLEVRAPRGFQETVQLRARQNRRRAQQVVGIAQAIMRGEDVMVAVTTMQRGVIDYGTPVAKLLMQSYDVRIKKLSPEGLVVALPCGKQLGRLDFVTPACPTRVRGARPSVVLYDELDDGNPYHRALMADMAILETRGAARTTLEPPVVADPVDFIVQMVDFRREEIDDVELEWEGGALWATVHLVGSSWDPEYDFTAAEVADYNRQRRH